MWTSSGRGQHFFVDLYDWFTVDEIRDFPATKEDFQKAGLNETVFYDYIEFVSRLYGEYFIRNNSLASKYKFSYSTKNKHWEEFIDFCIEHNLIMEFVDNNGNRMPYQSPNELDWFQFTYRFPECVNAMHICSVDEFRLALEMSLAEKPEGWFLDLKYDIKLIDDNGKILLSRYDANLDKLVYLTKQEVLRLINRIEDDIAELKKQIATHKKTVPLNLSETVCSRQEFIENLKEQNLWLRERVNLEHKLELLEDCKDVVEDYSEIHENIFESFLDDTLYIYKGSIICKKQSHHIEDATAILLNSVGKDIELNVLHCKDCDKFFLDYNTYKHYREKYGTILGNIKLVVNGDFVWSDFDLAEESTLHLCGYTVNQKDNLSDMQRHTIIVATIESGGMTKHEIIHLLNYFIDVNGAKRGNEQARMKWCRDLDFTLAYKTEKQKKFMISKIVPYQRNRFIINAHTENKQPIAIKKVDKNFLNKKVKHMNSKFGVGTIDKIDDSMITIRFSNGKETKFKSTVLEEGIVKVID